MGLDDKVTEGKGDVKERVGGATGDEDMQAEGKSDQAEGKFGQAADSAKDAAGNAKNAVTGS